MTDSNQTRSRKNHMLTVLVDLSHPAFADRGIGAQLNLLNVLQGVAEAIAVGSEATIIEEKRGGRAVGVLNIIADDDGAGKAAFDDVVTQTRRLLALDRARAEQNEGRQAAPQTQG